MPLLSSYTQKMLELIDEVSSVLQSAAIGKLKNETSATLAKEGFIPLMPGPKTPITVSLTMANAAIKIYEQGSHDTT